jgi:hypothetical protein
MTRYLSWLAIFGLSTLGWGLWGFLGALAFCIWVHSLD